MAFLTAEWRKLLMVNYRIDPKALIPYLPEHTELDYFQNECFVSLIGFLFQNTKVKGIGFPFHRNFEEINLRFYVKYKAENDWRRGVVFIKEIVPKHLITFIANTLYNENYVTLPTRHHYQEKGEQIIVKYEWLFERDRYFLEAISSGETYTLVPGSMEEFITEHYWGYAKGKNGITTEYGVEHPQWEIHPVQQYNIHCDFELLYGKAIADAMEKEPVSVFLAEGSAIKVLEGRKIR